MTQVKVMVRGVMAVKAKGVKANMIRVKAKKSFYSKRKKPSLFKRKWFWQLLVFVVIFFGIFYFLGFSRIFLLKAVKVKGNLTISSENIEAVAFENTEDVLPLLHSASIIFIDKPYLADVIKSRFPRVANVQIKRRLPNGLEIIIQEREAKAVLCQKESCYLIDQEGVAFKETLSQEAGEASFIFESLPTDNRETGLPQFEDATLAGKIQLGQKALETVDVKKLLAIAAGLSAAELTVSRILKVDAKRVNVILREGWQIFFNLDDQIPYQINNLKIILEKQIGQDRQKLEYIDLRFGSRIYYKFKEGLPQSHE